jgi:DeoR/GlpR family transcriptional regulator of sugar metabolism
MRVADHIVAARRQKLAELLQRHGYLPVRDLCRMLEVSEATARRDLAFLAGEQKITRLHGGAMAEFNTRFPSFLERQGVGARAKRRIGQLARSRIAPGSTVYFDSGTTVFAVADALRLEPVRPLIAVTNNLPVATVLAEVDGIAVHLIGGQFLPRQSALLGDTAARGAGLWRYDIALFSAEGATTEGVWNSNPSIVRLQQIVLQSSTRRYLCLDSAKLGRTAPAFLCPWQDIDALLTDAPDEHLAALGIQAERPPPSPQPATPDAAPQSGLEREPEDQGLTLPTELL